MTTNHPLFSISVDSIKVNNNVTETRYVIKALADLFNKGKISNLQMVDWISFESTLFMPSQLRVFVGYLNNDKIKLTLLNFFRDNINRFITISSYDGKQEIIDDVTTECNRLIATIENYDKYALNITPQETETTEELKAKIVELQKQVDDLKEQLQKTQKNRKINVQYAIDARLKEPDAVWIINQLINKGFILSMRNPYYQTNIPQAYKWMKSKSLFAYFADRISEALNMRSDNDYIPWSIFKKSFLDEYAEYDKGLHQGLKTIVSKYRNGANPPQGDDIIDSIIKESKTKPWEKDPF